MLQLIGLLVVSLAGCASESPRIGTRRANEPQTSQPPETETGSGGRSGPIHSRPSGETGDTGSADTSADIGLAEDCGNQVDDDGDGATDCADVECLVACVEDCEDSADNDGDQFVDCEDLDCDGTCPEQCDDTRDNDGNGLVDCEDPACPSCTDTCVGLDEDADGLVDCWDPDCACSLEFDQLVPLLSSSPPENTYSTLVAIGELTGDAFDDVVGGSAGLDIVEMWVMDPTVADGLSQDAAVATFTLNEDETVLSVSAGVDADMDGAQDLLLGVSSFSGVGFGALFAGPTLGALTAENATLRVYGVLDDRMGAGAKMIDDATGDGVPDVILGASTAGSFYGGYGRLSVHAGQTIGLIGVADALCTVETGGFEFNGLGEAVAGGDIDGDGVNDLAVGASGSEVLEDNAGRAVVLLGPLAGTLSIEDATLDILGKTFNGMAGTTVLAGADVDADGLSEVLVGSLEGKAWVFQGGRSGQFIADDAADLTLEGGSFFSKGSTWANLGGGEAVDLALSDQEAWPGGKVFLFFDPGLDGTLFAEDADISFEGPEGAKAGWTVEAGDLNGDGASEIAANINFADWDAGGTALGVLLWNPGW